ncbi:MAG TPA: hypothetical protein VI298_13900 [Geobacteraceae bacterium]
MSADKKDAAAPLSLKNAVAEKAAAVEVKKDVVAGKAATGQKAAEKPKSEKKNAQKKNAIKTTEEKKPMPAK